MINRRQWLYGMGLMAGAAAQPSGTLASTKDISQKPEHH
jgi:hypothetical protein